MLTTRLFYIGHKYVCLGFIGQNSGHMPKLAEVDHYIADLTVCASGKMAR